MLRHSLKGVSKMVARQLTACQVRCTHNNLPLDSFSEDEIAMQESGPYLFYVIY